MERLAIFIDLDNTFSTLEAEELILTPEDICGYLAQGRNLIESFALYSKADRASEGLEREKFVITNGSVQGKHYLEETDNDLPVKMTLEILEFTQNASPDIISLVSGRGSLAPLAVSLRRRGVRCEIVSTPGQVSPKLLECSSGLVDMRKIKNYNCNRDCRNNFNIDNPEVDDTFDF